MEKAVCNECGKEKERNQVVRNNSVGVSVCGPCLTPEGLLTFGLAMKEDGRIVSAT